MPKLILKVLLDSPDAACQRDLRECMVYGWILIGDFDWTIREIWLKLKTYISIGRWESIAVIELLQRGSCHAILLQQQLKK